MSFIPVRIPISFSCREPAPGDYPICAWINRSFAPRWDRFEVVQVLSAGRWPSIWTHWVPGAELPTRSPQELIAAIKANPPATDDPRWKTASKNPPQPKDFPIWVSSVGWAQQEKVPIEEGIHMQEFDEYPSAAWSPETRWFPAAEACPKPSIAATPSRPPLAVGDRVKLVTSLYNHEIDSPNPTWGGPLGWILGTVISVRPSEFVGDMPIRVRWDRTNLPGSKCNTYKERDLALARTWTLHYGVDNDRIVNIQNVPFEPSPTSGYIAGLQRKNEAQRKALASLHEKLARTQDELKEARMFKDLAEVNLSCTTSPHLHSICEEVSPCHSISWTPTGLLAEKNRLKKELEDWLERGRKNLETIKAALSDDEKSSLTFAYPSYAEFLADLITGLKRKLEAAEAKSAAAVEQLATRDEQVARQAQTIAKFQEDRRTPLPDTIGIPQAGDRWQDVRTGVVWAPEAALESLHDQLSAAEARARSAQSRLTSLDEWLKANAVWRSVRLCDNNDTVEQKVERLVACWKNQAEAIDRDFARSGSDYRKAALLDRAVDAVPGSTPESLVKWLEAMELTRNAG